MFCENCGSQLEGGAKFCFSCGHPIPAPPETYASPLQEQDFVPPPQQSYTPSAPYNSYTPPSWQPAPEQPWQPSPMQQRPKNLFLEFIGETWISVVLIPIVAVVLFFIAAFVVFWAASSGPADLTGYMSFLRGDLGVSTVTSMPVNLEMSERLPYSIRILIFGFLLSAVFAVPLGILAGLRRNRAADVICSAIPALSRCIPFFGFGLLLVKWLGIDLGWLPVVGITSWKSYIMPVLTLSMLCFGFMLPAVRASTIKAIDTDTSRHSDLNGCARVGSILAALFFGSVIVEVLFAVPGIGNFTVTGFMNRDTPVILGCLRIYMIWLTGAFLIASAINAVFTALLRINTGRGRQTA